ncbi:MAG: YbaN family protein [Hyphomonadaceae bacterium]
MMMIWRILGGLALVVGAIGIIVPGLPTTIFWILAALCFARSDPKIRDWIYARPGIGPQVELFIEEGQMTKSGKRGALIGMSFAALLLIYIFRDRPVVLAAGLSLIAIGALVVLSRKTGKV